MNLFDYCFESEKQALEIKIFPKESILFQEGEECKRIGIVLSGSIEIVSYAYNGNKIVWNRLEENGVFGNNLLFSSDPRYKGNVEAREESKIAFIEKEALIRILQENKDFLIEYLRIESEFGKKLNQKIKMYSLSAAEERIEYWIQSNGGKAKYETITKLAEELGLQRETVSRQLTQMIENGIIEKDGKCISWRNRE